MTELSGARPGDEAAIVGMIHELAEFEKAARNARSPKRSCTTALFGPEPVAYAHVAEVDGQAAATAVWFLNFSTWDGVTGIYLEDLFVRPAFRRRGLARKLLATLADECVGAVAPGCPGRC